MDYAKAFYCLSHDKLWKAILTMGIPDLLTCLLRNLCVGQDGTVSILYETNNWFKFKKGEQQGCLLSSRLSNLHADHLMRNAELDELQVGIKIGRRNFNNLRYVDDTERLSL